MTTSDRITCRPDKRCECPGIKGSRILVYDIPAMLAEGTTKSEILEDFPDIEPVDIHAC